MVNNDHYNENNHNHIDLHNNKTHRFLNAQTESEPLYIFKISCLGPHNTNNHIDLKNQSFFAYKASKKKYFLSGFRIKVYDSWLII